MQTELGGQLSRHLGRTLGIVTLPDDSGRVEILGKYSQDLPIFRTFEYWIGNLQAWKLCHFSLFEEFGIGVRGLFNTEQNCFCLF